MDGVPIPPFHVFISLSLAGRVGLDGTEGTGRGGIDRVPNELCGDQVV